jgi:glycosyltransferase involved in cell wall biosynthesis
VAGHVNETSLRCAYESADIFVLPSWSEGLPTVLLEAMDAGLPIVTTRIRGAADHLQEGVHACLVPPRNPERLREALAKMIANDDLRSRMGKANREKIKEFAPEAVAREYLMVLRQITDSNPRLGNSIPALSSD